MARSGVEAKPTWQSLPLEVRQQVEAALECRVIRAERAWGGYSPTPTFRLTLTDAKKVFFKGTGPLTNDFARAALVSEVRVYRELSPLIEGWLPELYSAFHFNDWHILLLEDLGPKSVPPWTPAKTRRVSAGLADFHRATRDKELPLWIPRVSQHTAKLNWRRVARNSRDFEAIAATAGDKQKEAYQWLQSAFPLLSSLTENMAERPGPAVLLHGDVRSDNLRLTAGGLRLFDWPFVAVGPVEFDLVQFAQTVRVEGGPQPEKVVDWYSQHNLVNPATLTAYIAWWAAFFAEKFWQPEIPGLPRLRPFQRAQLRVLLSWLARQFSLEEPDWL
jgi:Ser/Thr protein kinase RdoA (MazF antagonist)